MSFGIVAGVVGTVAGAAISGRSAKKAADTQAASADRATELQREQYEQTRADQEPWRRGGENALYSLLTKTGVGGNVTGADYGEFMQPFNMQKDYLEDPGYQFRLGEGMKALQRGSAAAGRLGSGRYMKDLTRFGQGEASNEFNNSWNRWNTGQNQRFNRLASIAGIGQTANNQIQSAGQNYVTQAGNNMMGAANARASGYVGGANAVNNAIGQGWNMYQGNRMMNLLGQNQGGQSGWSNPNGWGGTSLGNHFLGNGTGGD